MSTRCNVVVNDSYGDLWFYRHSDGYPSVTGESLKKFLRWLIDGKIRNNVEQASGWLILMGAAEYGNKHEFVSGKWIDVPKASLTEPPADDKHSGWKCGAYEPSKGEHGDIEYLYVIDLVAKEIRCCRPEKRGAPFYTVTAANIDQPIGEDDTDD